MAEGEGEKGTADPATPDPSTSADPVDVIGGELDDKVRADKIQGSAGEPAPAPAEKRVGPDIVKVARRKE